jgi:AAA domain
VVLLSAEDGLADTIRPRLDAAGADTERIVGLSPVADDFSGGPISFPKDLETIERAIGYVEASLLVVDPLMAFLSGGTDSHKDQDVRRVLTPLAALAERTRAAVLIVRHLNKAAGGNPLYRGGGSIGIIGAARSGLVVAEDPEDPDRRVLASTKHNLSRAAPSLVFHLGTAPNGAARVIWGGISSLGAVDILKEQPEPEERSAISKAKRFLLEELKDGPMAANRVRKNARAVDISERTLKRAKEALGVGSKKQSDGSWCWVLPEKEAEASQFPTDGTLGTVGPLGKDANPDPDDSAYLREGGQGDRDSRCNHDYRNGIGCYLCDPEHPYRRKQEVRQ